jgi:hypothetical protein
LSQASIDRSRERIRRRLDTVVSDLGVIERKDPDNARWKRALSLAEQLRDLMQK